MRKSFFLLLSGVLFTACGSTPPENLGIREGKFSPCPDSPNCVSSYASPEDERHFIAPLAYSGSREDARRKLLDILSAYGSRAVTVTQAGDDYIRAEFRTPLLRFTDDVEFYLPADSRVIHLRSASRVGYSDMGANRKRIEGLRSDFEK